MKPFAMNRCQLIVKVIVHFVFIMGLILSVTTIYSAQIGNGIEPQIEKSHPRLLIIRDDVDRIRQSVKSYSLDDYMDMKGRISRDLHAAKMNDIIYSNDGGIVRDMAFVGLISEDKTYKDKAIEWGLFLADIQASVGNDTNQRARLLAMSFVYDWLYDDLTEKQRHIIRMGIINHIELLKGFLDKPIYTGGHSRYGNACIVAGLIALYGDYGEWQGAEYLKKERRAWVEGYNPVQSYIAKDGGYHMGWAYGASYTEPLIYLVWEKATGETWGEEWRKNQAYWYIYGMRGDGTLPRAGDCYSTDPKSYYIKAIIAVSAAKFKDCYSEWFYRQYLNEEGYRIWRIIFRDPSVIPLSSGDERNPLPLSRNFENSGYVIARDLWNKDSTHLVFKSSPFYTINHHHKDQNHFELSYKGSLIIDSGSYQPPGYGSPHWKNYYTRTIAHNTMVVYDKDEHFSFFGEKVSNDGGQRFMVYTEKPIGDEPTNIQELLSDKYRFCGISGFASNKGCCWMQGDASKAYNQLKVKSYVRDIFMVNRPIGRKHPIILVLDRVVLNKTLIPRILFHSNEKPIIRDNYFSIKNVVGGYLHGEILFPAGSRMDLIGGEGKEWFVDGVNYDLPPDWEKAKRGVDAGAWRIEVSQGQSSDHVDFLTLLSVDDVKDFQGKPQASGIEGKGFYGAVCNKNLLVICNTTLDHKISFSGEKYKDISKIYICGHIPKAEFDISVNNKKYSLESPEVIVCN